ncbi:hypothetical protein HYALB_00005061 [Hymenoscyphus albidus]|uniref:Major facilitator superfamily (MFS) profile domain-containing protein n=1 Tax=Hymenoscyphus albidus TaxID=595503 RepID=A0A9N9LVW7_9HELO|nr:hypothetical protein HYALB_00005061 [Hymenoscyphus albidus]
MSRWGFRWFKLFLNPFKNDDFEHISESDRRLYILGRLEEAEPSEWSWVVVVAGVGFFTDAYSIFAINMVIPILGIIYYPGAPNNGIMTASHETALSVLTLGGSIIGQVAFGIAADIWGRRKMYGLELIITIAATLGCVMASNGVANSMSLIVWLMVWRFVLGIGIGADYPLSAVICSEFAPTRLRGKMLTVVFMCQPLGQLAATLVTLIAMANQKSGIPADAKRDNCNTECLKTLDSIWRWIIGVGVIPAVIALWFRLTIIESPRYTADVARDSKKAASELQGYLLSQAQAASSTSIGIAGMEHNAHRLRRTTSGIASVASGEQQRISGTFSENNNAREFDTASNRTSIASQQDSRDLEPAEESIPPPEPSWQEFKQYFWKDGNLRTLIATSFCWMAIDLPFYGLGMSSPHIINVIWYGKEPKDHFIYDMIISDVWQSLIVVSLGAIIGCLITIFTIDKLGRRTIQMNGFFWLFILFVVIGGSFEHLYENGGNPAIVVLYILCQIFFNFGPNTTTYIIPAELFPTRYRGLSHGISAAFGKLGSVIAQLFLAYVDYGHGGTKINKDTKIQIWLRNSLLIFSSFMLLGLFVTWKWIPGQEHGPDGKVKTLEQWEVGRTTPNGFSQTKTARAVRRVWKVAAGVIELVYLFLDKLAGGDEKEVRELARKREVEMRDFGEGVNGIGNGNRNRNGEC